jgi:hypothetical protein
MEHQFLRNIVGYILPGVTFVLGLIVNYYFNRITNKIPKLKYKINKSFLGISAQDNLFGKVQILYNDVPVENLFLCTLNLENTSRMDFKDLEFTVWCDIDTIILVAHASKMGKIDPLALSDKYLNEWNNINEQNGKLILSKRIYYVPVFNRDEIISLSCLVTNLGKKEPGIYINCDYPGIKVEADFAKPNLFWGENRDAAVLWGLLLSGLILIPIIFFPPSKIFVGICGFIIGVFCIIPGLLFIKFGRKIKALIR